MARRGAAPLGKANRPHGVRSVRSNKNRNLEQLGIQGATLAEVILTHSDQHLLETFIETISGAIAADIAQHQRNNEIAHAEMKILLQSQAAVIRKRLAEKGMMRREPIMRQNVSRLGAVSVRDALMPDPLEDMARIIEGGDGAAA